MISQDLKTEVNRILLKPSVREMLGAKNIANTRIVLGTLFNKAQTIVTGDKHLSKLKKIKGIEILSPEQFCLRRRL